MAQHTDSTTPPTGRLRPDKRAAIMDGGREVFARDGYERASIDAIATVAGVSTRTIYKHFTDKAALFAAVVDHSTNRVAQEQTELIARRLSVVDRADAVATALLDFAIEWQLEPGPSDRHRALITQVHGEAAHLGDDLVDRWWRAGPGRVRAELAAVFARWAEHGWLRIADPDRAVVHFVALVAARPGCPTERHTDAQQREWTTAGVEAFVRIYRPD